MATKKGKSLKKGKKLAGMKTLDQPQKDGVWL